MNAMQTTVPLDDLHRLEARSERTVEILLVLVTVGLTAVLHQTGTMRAVVLNLFFLPVVLAGFFLGRYRAGVLALLAVVMSTVVVAQDLGSFAAVDSPIAIGLGITLWGAVLGLTAMLVGTLSDDRGAKAVEAHEAHVGVVEVLARYLQAANPNLENRAKKVASLCEAVGRKMRLSNKEIDDIRVAALLIDMENIEITARVIRKAVGELGDDEERSQKTFHGSDLVRSLGAVMSGAFPLMLNQSTAPGSPPHEVPFGARIVRAVREYVRLADDPWEGGEVTPAEIVEEMRYDTEADYHPAVLHALEEVVTHPASRDALLSAEEAQAIERITSR